MRDTPHLVARVVSLPQHRRVAGIAGEEGLVGGVPRDWPLPFVCDECALIVSLHHTRRHLDTRKVEDADSVCVSNEVTALH